ncbi:MAG: adenine-specific methyltransferase EcoRI family protein [Gemmatimonadetes bacterium]|nr:adenine-specific methyltransferase EcoRI family protein [Gemmatimonadota bacterium]
MSLNENLGRARRQKKDEFYTQLSDIENELRHYAEHFRGKVVYCNCDDPRISNFFHYFSYNFERLGLKKLITACYKNQERDLFSSHDSERAIWLEYDGNPRGGRTPDVDDIGIREFQGDGDFRSAECIELLKQADIVVTNPPFSKFREYIAQLMEYDKKFLIIGSQNAITYKEVFPLIKDNTMWLGVTPKGQDMLFDVPEGYAQELAATGKEGSAYRVVEGVIKGRLGNAAWFTNLDHAKRHEELILYKRYSADDYPTYDNYDAINVDKTAEIPMDYDGPMGVPITFLDKWNPDQFEILGITASADRYGLKTKKYTLADAPNYSYLNSREGGVLMVAGRYRSTYRRLLIRKMPPR